MFGRSKKLRFWQATEADSAQQRDKIMARMNLFKDIVMPVVWLPISAFIVLAAVMAVTMSLERTLGRPIPAREPSGSA